MLHCIVGLHIFNRIRQKRKSVTKRWLYKIIIKNNFSFKQQFLPAKQIVPISYFNASYSYWVATSSCTDTTIFWLLFIEFPLHQSNHKVLTKTSNRPVVNKHSHLPDSTPFNRNIDTTSHRAVYIVIFCIMH